MFSQRNCLKKKVIFIYSLSLLLCGFYPFISSFPVFAADPIDRDHDGIANVDDNCPNAGNPLQYDIDGDGIGLVCDNIGDADNDGVADVDDNCPNDPNPLQYDIDGDGIGVVCDIVENDSDNDGVADADDNCPNDPNPKQYDLDGDGIGIVCDNIDDPDNDGVSSSEDNCPNDGNPRQYDLDGDGIGLVCDNVNDSDNDGIADGDDNCPNDPNPKQYDLDGDGIGLVCDADTVSNQDLIDRSLASEARAQKERDRALFAEDRAQGDRDRAIYSETQAQARKDRYISFEQGAQSSRDRKIQFERRAMKSIISARNGSGPQFGCGGCHDESQNGRRIITGDNGDFTSSSHHVQGDVEAIDCLSCHYTGDHKSGTVKLVDPDEWTDVIYEYDPANPETIEPFCQGCHDSDGMLAGFGPRPFSDLEVVPDVMTAHYGQTCTDCHSRSSGFNGHIVAHGGAGTGCITCHGHETGYEYAPGQFSLGTGSKHSHSTHTENDADDLRGPNVNCDTCHDTNSFPNFKSGTDSNGDGVFSLSETDVCNTCHSPGGSYNGVDDANIGAKNNWKNGVYVNGSLSKGKSRWCVGCHDEIPSQINGVTASNVAGDEDSVTNYGIGYGYFKTGHGLPVDQQYPASGGATMGAGLSCTECHDTTLAHIDGVARTYSASALDGESDDYRHGYRLKMVGQQLPLNIPREAAVESWEPAKASDFALCIKCHEFNPFENNDSTDTNYRSTNITTQDVSIKNAHYYHLSSWGGLNSPDWDSDWSGPKEAPDGDSRPSCVTCHNVHGSPQLAMVRDGQLVGREPGLPIAYYNDGAGITFDPTCSGGLPSVMNITLNNSNGTMYDPTGPSNLCGNCHGGCWDTSLHTPYMRDPADYSAFNDADGDGVYDAFDNCPVNINPNQEDTDSDAIGDVCDLCREDPLNIHIPTPDTDGDGIGDNCDTCPDDILNDTDGDGICGSVDICPNDYYNDSQDNDGVCADEDNCPAVANSNQADSDGDLVGDLCDNCPDVANPNQIDSDGDGIGNLCDAASVTPMIVGGVAHSVVLKADGTVWAWGLNTSGQTGDGSTTNHNTPTQVQTGTGYLEGVVAIATDQGSNHTVALKSDGTVWTWGSNSYGQLGIGSTGGFETTAVQVVHPLDASGYLTDVVDIAATSATSAAVKSDGTVWTWGSGGRGEIGNFTKNNYNEPQQVKIENTHAFLTGITKIAGGDQHFVSIKSDGSVWTWGNNDAGGCYTISDPDPGRTWNYRDTAYQATDYAGYLYNDAVDVEAGLWLTVMVNNETGQGTVHGWGRSVPPNYEYGLVGMEGFASVSKLAVGRRHVLAIKDDATIWGSGNNCDGQLGTGVMYDCTPHQDTVQTPGLTNVVAIGAGQYHSLSVVDNGDGTYSYWTWGANGSGQLGVSGGTQYSPVQVPGL